ncbi:MAG: MarR family winged helix-turn-helix transcriptional regulator [Candidatus Spyradocola sp.]
MKENSLLALSGVYHIKERLFSRLLRQRGLENISPAQSRILMALWEQDDIPVRQLAGLTSLDKSTLSLSLSRMEQSGIVQRAGDPMDRRIVRVKLTEHGKTFRSVCAETMRDIEEILYRGVDAADVEVFQRVLERILLNLTEQEQARGI